MIITPIGYEQISSATGKTSLNPPAGATRAIIQLENADGRWGDDQTLTPTLTEGHVLIASGLAGDYLDYRGDLSLWRFIETATGAELNISYYA